MIAQIIKKMSVKDFRAMGGLQEINRCFFHPRGLALEVVKDDEGKESFGEIWDCRDDNEGIIFGKGVIKQKYIDTFNKAWKEKEEYRKKVLKGKTIQEF